MSHSEITRRTVLAGSAAGAAVILAACSSGSGSRDRKPAAEEKLVALSEIEDGATVVVTTAAGAPVVITRKGDQVTGMSGVCPHAGCSVRRELEGLLCPCHNSTFSLTGERLSGPANANLSPTPLKVVNGNVVTG